MKSDLNHESNVSFLATAQGAGKLLVPLALKGRAARCSTDADLCRLLGLNVGDTIVGTETYGKDWNQARLTLLWIGEELAVWSEIGRTNRSPEWNSAEETANWTLEGRPWFKVVDSPDRAENTSALKEAAGAAK